MGSRPRVGKYKRFTETPQPDRYAHAVPNACLGIPAERIASICQVDVSTARRWKSGKRRVPYVVQMILDCNLGVFGFKEWEQWRIDGANIFSPDQWRINRNDALSVQLLLAQIAQRDATIKALEDTIAYLRTVQALEDQPRPEDIPKSAG